MRLLSNLFKRQRRDLDFAAHNHVKAIGTSLFAHAAILLILTLLPRIEPDFRNPLSELFLEDWDDSFELPEADPPITKFKLSDEQLAEIGSLSEGVLEEAAPPPIGETLHLDEALDDSVTPFGPVDNERFMNFFTDDGNRWISELAGMPGATVNAYGDVGSVERITVEILEQLERNKVLVLWLMDASESLRDRREEIIKYFDRVYQELETLVDKSDQPLLTSVAAFGERLVPMLKEPTDNRKAIRQAVRNIERDESGVENVFSAIRATVIASKPYLRRRRKLMIVVVTDEKGDDLSVLDEAVVLLKRQKALIYVLGPSAPFGKQKIRIRWADRDSGEVYFLPVDRGPETAQIEHAKLSLWDGGPGIRNLSSGFGPFGLTRIVYENGGIYFLQDDDTFSGPSFDAETLFRYRPEYVPLAQYSLQMAKHPLRMAVLRTAQACNQLLEKRLPSTFLAAGIQFEIRNTQSYLNRVVEVLARSLSELESVKMHRPKETLPRWQAHYDLLMGRLLANQVRCQSYGRLLEAMYMAPRQPQDGVHNAWKLARNELTDSANNKHDARALKETTQRACEFLDRTIKEHPQTPWAFIAQRELEFPMAFQWQPAFVDPPEGVSLPWDKVPWKELTDAQKNAKTKFEKRKKRQRKPKPAPKKPVIKRPPPKL